MRSWSVSLEPRRSRPRCKVIDQTDERIRQGMPYQAISIEEPTGEHEFRIFASCQLFPDDRAAAAAPDAAYALSCVLPVSTITPTLDHRDRATRWWPFRPPRPAVAPTTARLETQLRSRSTGTHDHQSHQFGTVGLHRESLAQRSLKCSPRRRSIALDHRQKRHKPFNFEERYGRRSTIQRRGSSLFAISLSLS